MLHTSKKKTNMHFKVNSIILMQLAHLITDVGDTEIMMTGAYSWVLLQLIGLDN